ncbi:MAG TPA: YceH family protein [Malonomonas sp.]
MEILLDENEVRVLGAFIEKELTTPDYYPLSPNALTNACNQKSNRDPVLQLEEPQVLAAVESLRNKGLAMQSQEGSRVVKYRHCLRERLYLENQELAILGELLLRGAQTPGEIRARADRMASLASLEEVDTVLQELLDKEPPLICKLDRQPGRKEHRYAHLLAGEVSTEEPAPTAAMAAQPAGRSFSQMETELAELREEIAKLKNEFQRFKKQFE